MAHINRYSFVESFHHQLMLLSLYNYSMAMACLAGCKCITRMVVVFQYGKSETMLVLAAMKLCVVLMILTMLSMVIGIGFLFNDP